VAIGADAVPTPADTPPASGEHPRHERIPDRPERPARTDRPGQERPQVSHKSPVRSERGDYQQRGKPRGDRGDRPDRAPRGDRPDRDPALRAQYIKGRSEGRDRRDKEPDPNSPFAKLAALKEQLEANAKEPRQT
jgi:ATP-dependent RNA helicase SUPV3L1/SUV3